MKELLIKLQEYTIKNFNPNGIISDLYGNKKGFCHIITEMHLDYTISDEEADYLVCYVVDEMPIYDEIWGWEPGLLKPRLNWLKKHISIQ